MDNTVDRLPSGSMLPARVASRFRMIRSLLHIALTTVLAAVLAVMTIVLIVGLAIAGPLWYVQRRRVRELRPQIALEALNQRYALGDIWRTDIWRTETIFSQRNAARR